MIARGNLRPLRDPGPWVSTMRNAMPNPTRYALGLYILCFSIGAANHAHDFARFGWRPYRWGSTPLEIFWTSLIVLDIDIAVVGLLLSDRRRSGLGLALTVMTLDVAANGYALLGLEIPSFTVPLLQTTFFGFVLGSIAFLWPRQPAGAA